MRELQDFVALFFLPYSHNLHAASRHIICWKQLLSFFTQFLIQRIENPYCFWPAPRWESPFTASTIWCRLRIKHVSSQCPQEYAYQQLNKVPVFQNKLFSVQRGAFNVEFNNYMKYHCEDPTFSGDEAVSFSVLWLVFSVHARRSFSGGMEYKVWIVNPAMWDLGASQIKSGL